MLLLLITLLIIIWVNSMQSCFIFAALLIGSFFVILGILGKIWPPKKINMWYGYRSSTSMQDQYSWDLGQQLAAKYMVLIGLGMTAISFLPCVFQISSADKDRMSSVAIIGGALLIILLSEISLRKTLRK